MSQDLSGWSDKTVCRLVKSDGGVTYVEEASSRGLDCKAPIRTPKVKAVKSTSSASAQGMSGWSDEIICLLILRKPDEPRYTEEVASRNLD